MVMFAGMFYKYNNGNVFSCIRGPRLDFAVLPPAVMYIGLKYITAAVFRLKNVVLAEYSPGDFHMVIFAGMFYKYNNKIMFSCFGGPWCAFAVYTRAVMYISLNYITAVVFQLTNVVRAEYSLGNFSMVIFAGMFYKHNNRIIWSCLESFDVVSPYTHQR